MTLDQAVNELYWTPQKLTVQEVRNILVKVAASARREGYSSGYDDGFSEGYEVGYEDGNQSDTFG